MRSEDDLNIGIEVCRQVEQSLLPLDVQRDFWFVHEKDEGFAVLHQNGEQYDEHLLFARRELVRRDGLAITVEVEFVLVAFDGLASLVEEVIYQVLEMCLFMCQSLHFGCSFWVVAGEEFYHAVREVDLIVEPFASEVVDVQVEFSLHLVVRQLVHQLVGKHRSVEGANHFEIDGFSLLREELEVYAVLFSCVSVDVEQVHDDAVEYGALSHAIDAAEDVHARLQVPADMFVAVPEAVYLNAFNVLSVHE